MSNFRIGQKVVCVNDDQQGQGYTDEIWPVKGQVYTVRAIDDLDCLLLNEIHNRAVDDLEYDEAGEISFWEGMFRPAVEPKTDISIFTKMLDGSRVLETTVTKG